MKRVLLLPSSDYLGHPFPQRHNQIFERIHEEDNFEVHVFNFNLFHKRKLKSNTILHDIDGIKINNTGQYYLLNGLNHTSKLRKIIANEDIDILVFSNLFVPFLYNIIDLIQNTEIPIIFDVPDFYPTSAAGYLTNVNSVLGKFITGSFESIFRFLLKKSSTVSVASYALKNYAKKIGIKKVVHIPNGISQVFYKPNSGEQIRIKFGIDNSEILLGYIGSIEFWLDLEPLLKGLSMAVKKGVSAKLLIVGKRLHTDYFKNVSTWIKKYEIEEHVIWYNTFIPYDKVPEYMAALDLGTIPFDVKNPTAFYSSPNKLWEYASQMTSILCTSIPVAMYNLDCLTITNNPEDYLNAIQKFNNNDLILQKKKNNAQKKALQMTWENSAKIMCDTINQLI